MKLLAVAQRGSRRDFTDIYALGLHGLSLGEMLEYYRRKNAVDNVFRVLQALNYFAGVEQEPSPEMLVDADWNQIKRTIQQWTAEYSG